jgi:hypothetical protein
MQINIVIGNKETIFLLWILVWIWVKWFNILIFNEFP